jgi:hypothetical protein
MTSRALETHRSLEKYLPPGLAAAPLREDENSALVEIGSDGLRRLPPILTAMNFAGLAGLLT